MAERQRQARLHQAHQAEAQQRYRAQTMAAQHEAGETDLNVVLPPSTAAAARVADTSIRLVVVEGGAPQSYLLRVKTAVEAEQLLARLNATIPKEGH